MPFFAIHSLLGKKKNNNKIPFMFAYVACFNKDFKSEWNISFIFILWNWNALINMFIASIHRSFCMELYFFVIVIHHHVFWENEFYTHCVLFFFFSDVKTVEPICKSQVFSDNDGLMAAVPHHLLSQNSKHKAKLFSIEAGYHGFQLIWRRMRNIFSHI